VKAASSLLPTNQSAAGAEMFTLAAELFPVCRSITGDGLRTTLRRIAEEIPITIHEVPTGTAVLDWTIPREWNIRDAWIKNSHGERVVDFRRSNLHVVNYSVPVHVRMDLAALKTRLHSLTEHPDWIPYRTSYYREDWGFCLPHRALLSLPQDDYEVCIDSTLEPGALSYGELLIRGESTDEFLFSAHCCHPSLANDNLSGVTMAVALARHLQRRRTRLSYRFLFVPGTIGAITWLAGNEAHLSRIKHGLVLTCVGDPAAITYKRSRRGSAPIDRALEQVMARSEEPHRIVDFSPCGYDERQYCSPGFNLPVGCLMRSVHGTFPEYHTSADNLDFIRPESLADTFDKVLQAVELIESAEVSGAPDREGRDVGVAGRVASGQRRCLNLKPRGEPQLGKYGIYEALPHDIGPALWVLNYSDGHHSLAEIAARGALSFDKVAHAADILITRGLLKEVES
jgi:aminopeptidase-like protein